MNRCIRSALTHLAVLSVALAQSSTPGLPPVPAGVISEMNLMIHAVVNLDNSVAFYRDVFGFETTTPVPAKPAANEYIRSLSDRHEGLFRSVRFKITGAEFPLALTEFTDLERKQAQANLWDPAAAGLIFHVRDLDAAAAAVKRAYGSIVSAKGEPVWLNQEQGGVHALLARDLDGFLLELIQASTSEMAAASGRDKVLSAGILITVGNLKDSMAFYNGLLGFDIHTGPTADSRQEVLDLAGASGGSLRTNRSLVPGSTTQIDFLAFRGLKGTPFKIRPADPGAPVLALSTKDVNGLLDKLKAVDVTVVSTGGVPANNNVFIRDPDGLLIELVQTK